MVCQVRLMKIAIKSKTTKIVEFAGLTDSRASCILVMYENSDRGRSKMSLVETKIEDYAENRVINAHKYAELPSSWQDNPATMSHEDWVQGLLLLRTKIVSSGVKLLDWDEINAEVAAIRSSAADTI